MHCFLLANSTRLLLRSHETSTSLTHHLRHTGLSFHFLFSMFAEVDFLLPALVCQHANVQHVLLLATLGRPARAFLTPHSPAGATLAALIFTGIKKSKRDEAEPENTAAHH